jgi:hypothetical protein
MPSIAYKLIFLFLTDFLIQPTACALPDYIQNLELDDITSLWDKVPSIIGKVKDASMLLNNGYMKVTEFFFLKDILYIKMSRKKKLSI